MQTACNLGSADPIIIGGVLYTAQVGLNYRRLQKGRMTKTQFKRSLKLGASQMGMGLAGGTSGAAVGFFIGSFGGPVGSVIGTVIGGVYGGIKGQGFGTKLFQDLEDSKREKKELKH